MVFLTLLDGLSQNLFKPLQFGVRRHYSMSKTFRFGVVALPLIILGLASDLAKAQTPPPAEPAQTPAPQEPPAPNPTAAPATPGQQPASAAAPLTVAPTQAPPPKEPFILEDGGLYIEPIYWINTAQPRIRGGNLATAPGDFPYQGRAKASIGAELGFPAGRSNTLRVSYFRVQGNSEHTLAQTSTIFSEAYTAGDFINATYKIQAVKVSWDYLSYTWRKPTTTIHLKTLYEVQYVTTKIETAAPFKLVTTDASGNVDDNTASGNKAVILPTFGMAIGSQLGKHFRWDVRGSGFGLPKRTAIGDVQASIGIRFGRVELVAGERLYYFKTSPKTDMYVTDTLQGVWGGLRFAWRGNL
jgi:hypothetical protein